VTTAGRTRRAATGLTRGLTLLGSLALLRRRLALLVRSLTGRVICLAALATTLFLTFLALVALALLCAFATLRLAFWALLHLVLPSLALACGLPTLALARAGLLRRTLLAFALALLRLGFRLARLRLPCRRLTLRLAALLRRILLALLLGTTLRLAGGALLVARARGAAFRL